MPGPLGYRNPLSRFEVTMLVWCESLVRGAAVANWSRSQTHDWRVMSFSLVLLKIRCVDRLMHVKSVVAQMFSRWCGLEGVELKPKTTVNLPCGGADVRKIFQESKIFRGVDVWKRMTAAQVTPSSLNRDSKLRDLSPIAFVLLHSVT
ncbi:hypothetical protein TNCV_4334181 [Trichonephila clavipes]|nr:hypothetical protein TNCV_4334181 [Trichonephila clavipes]